MFVRRLEIMELADADIPWAIAMPKETVEAWVLGDEASINEVTDAATPPSRPEALWGAKQDPTSNHPKQVLTRLVGKRLSTEGFARAGSVALPSRLCVSCPESFIPFSKEVADFSGLPPCTP